LPKHNLLLIITLVSFDYFPYEFLVVLTKCYNIHIFIFTKSMYFILSLKLHNKVKCKYLRFSILECNVFNLYLLNNNIVLINYLFYLFPFNNIYLVFKPLFDRISNEKCPLLSNIVFLSHIENFWNLHLWILSKPLVYKVL